jgi:uncharacterized protein (UPF0212 family)
MRTINVYQDIDDLNSPNVEVTAETIEIGFLIGLNRLREEFDFCNEELMNAGWTICPHCNQMSEQEIHDLEAMYPANMHHTPQ